MVENNEIRYDALQARLTAPETLLAAPELVLTGVDAARFGREFLLREYGSAEAIEEAMRPGRPRVGSKTRVAERRVGSARSDGVGSSPVVRGVISHNELDALKLLSKRTGKKQSEIVRLAIHNLLVAEQLVE